jgi:hypothetical protein
MLVAAISRCALGAATMPQRRDALEAATMPQRRDAIEAATVSLSFFRPSTFRYEVGFL